MQTYTKLKSFQFGKFFNPKVKICPDLELEWDNKFKLLGLNIDNNLQNIDNHFETVHARTLSTTGIQEDYHWKEESPSQNDF